MLDREVALQIVDARRAATSRSEAVEQAVENKARILAKLEHPGLVPIHDFGQLPDGRLFYAMKRVRGDRLDRWVAAGRDLTARLGVFLRICDAVAFAHAHGVIHRDLKPANVMVGEFGEVLVLDWGVAAAKGDSDLATAVVGTRDYMAPEQMRADAHLDERADDVFARRDPRRNGGRHLRRWWRLPTKRVRPIQPRAIRPFPALARRRLKVPCRGSPSKRIANA